MRRADHERQPQARTEQPEGHDQERRPDEVELLLDAERPEMAERRRIGRGEVVGRLQGEAHVPERQRRCGAVLGDTGYLEGREEERSRDHRDRDGRQDGRQDAPQPPRIEATEIDPAGLLVLAKQQARDQEPGDHEEDVDAREAAAQARQADVVPEHGEHRDRAQALHVREEFAVRFALGHVGVGD